MFPFMRVIRRPLAAKYDPDKHAQVYQTNQKLRKLERGERKWKNVARALEALPPGNERNQKLDKARSKVKEYQDRIIAFTDESGARRKATRELIKGE